MDSLFLNPLKPLSTCSTLNCQGCLLQSRLQCHFGGRELLRFFGIAFPAFILGGIGIARLNAWLLVPWITVIVSYFGLVEIRVMCSHCPHYAEPGTKSLQCWANYGSPKLWKYRSGPMSRGEKVVFFVGLFLVAAYPMAFLLARAQWLLLVLFAVTVAGMAALMGRLMCTRCMNFACPLNRVDRVVRNIYFACNPVVARAWQAKGPE
jgi:steroid 5-alpha reductase family enzyme